MTAQFASNKIHGPTLVQSLFLEVLNLLLGAIRKHKRSGPVAPCASRPAKTPSQEVRNADARSTGRNEGKDVLSPEKGRSRSLNLPRNSLGQEPVPFQAGSPPFCLQAVGQNGKCLTKGAG